MKRLFIAIKIETDNNFLSTYQELRKLLVMEKIKWVAPQKMHLTLKFLGKTTDDQLLRLHDVLPGVASRYSEFDMQFNKAGIFGSSYRPRVIWLGDEQSQEVRSLGEDMLDSLDAAGFARDRQNFVPHLTLGRIKQINSKKQFQKVMDQFRSAFSLRVRVNEIVLYQSILKPAGPLYIALKKYKLQTKQD